MIRLEYLTSGTWKYWTSTKTVAAAKKMMAERINKTSIVRIAPDNAQFTSAKQALAFLLERYHQMDEDATTYITGVESLTDVQVRQMRKLIQPRKVKRG